MKEVTEQKEKAEKETREAVTNVQRKITEIQALKDENSELRSSLAKTRRELDEISEETTVGGATEENVNVLRKYKRDLESKVMELVRKV
jgi:predicted outer membrane protein